MLSVLMNVPLLSLMARLTPDLCCENIWCIKHLSARSFLFHMLCAAVLSHDILTRLVQCCSGDTASGTRRRTCRGSAADRWSYLRRGLQRWHCRRCWQTGHLRSQKTRHFQPGRLSVDKRSSYYTEISLQVSFMRWEYKILQHDQKTGGASIVKSTSKLFLQDEMELSFMANLNFNTGGSTFQSAVPKHSGLLNSLLRTIRDSL